MIIEWKEEADTLEISGGFLGIIPPYFFLTTSSCKKQRMTILYYSMDMECIYAIYKWTWIWAQLPAVLLEGTCQHPP